MNGADGGITALVLTFHRESIVYVTAIAVLLSMATALWAGRNMTRLEALAIGMLTLLLLMALAVSATAWLGRPLVLIETVSIR